MSDSATDNAPSSFDPAAADPAASSAGPANQIAMQIQDETKCPACQARLDVRGLAPFSETECPACKARLTVPTKFSHFTLLRRLGSGGMGTAFLAEDEALGRKVAIKVMQKALCADEKAFATFKNEAQSAARLNHPHVAQVYSFGQEQGSPFLEMELVPGGDLGTFIADGTKLDPAFVLRVGREIAEGLKAAEEVGLFHGDVKPDNILFDESMNAKLVDFGIASRSSQGQSDELWGTPYYIAPEKVQKKMNSARSDIYSLGATLYHAIAGQPPYDGADAVEVIKARFKGPPQPLEKLRPDVEPEVSRIISRMMYTDLFMRYPNYNSLIGDLDKYLAGVSAMRKQGPKAASATIRAKLTGTGPVKADAPEATQGSGKKKFVLSKGQMAAAAEEAEEAKTTGAAAASPSGGRIRLKGRGGATLKAGAPAGGPPAAPGEASGEGTKKKGGKGVLVAICVVVGVLVLGIGGAIWSVMRAKAKTRAQIAQYIGQMEEVAAKFPALDEKLDKLFDDVKNTEAEMDKRLPEVDAFYFKATGSHYRFPDTTPPERVEEPSPEELAAAEAAAAAEGAEGDAGAKADDKAQATAEEKEEAPAPKAKPKGRGSAVDRLAKAMSEKAGYPISTDLIVQSAKAADMTADEFAKAKLAEMGLEEPEEEPEAAAKPRVVAVVRELRLQTRDAYWNYNKAGESPVFAPLSAETTVEAAYAALQERQKAYDERAALVADMAECAAQAKRELQRMIEGIRGVGKAAKKYINQRDREKREAEAAAEAAAAEAAAQAEKERLSAVEAEEISRVQEVARSHQPLIDAFDYDGYQEKMHRMEKELTSPAALEELAWTIRRAEHLKDYRKFLLDDVRRHGDLKGAYRKHDVLGLSADRKRLLVFQMQDVKIDSLTLGDWIRLSWCVLENREPSRAALDNIALGTQYFNAAVFYYMHGNGDYAATQRCYTNARKAFELRGALRADALRLIPILAQDAAASGLSGVGEGDGDVY